MLDARRLAFGAWPDSLRCWLWDPQMNGYFAVSVMVPEGLSQLYKALSWSAPQYTELPRDDLQGDSLRMSSCNLRDLRVFPRGDCSPQRCNQQERISLHFE